ncbi:MAG: TRAP transporter small permease [Lachnospiraceae bacterium]
MKNYYFAVMQVIRKIIQYAVAAVLLFMVILMFIEVLRRYFLGQQFVWSEELIRYLAVWVAFLGGAAAFGEKSLVCFDLASGWLKGTSKFALDICSNTIVLAFLLFIMFLGIKTVTAPSTVNQIGIGLKVSMAFPYMAIPIGVGMMALFSINNYLELIGNFLIERKGLEGAEKL